MPRRLTTISTCVNSQVAVFLAYPGSTNSRYTRAGLIRFVTDHLGVGFWQPNFAPHPPTLAGSQCVR